MKKIYLTVTLILTFLVSGFLVGTYYFMQKDVYWNYNKINYDKVLEQEEENYYIYYYSKSCIFCIRIEEIFKEFEENNIVYLVDMGKKQNKQAYVDYTKFHVENDIEIGEINKYGEIDFYLGENEEKYVNSNLFNSDGRKIEYEIVVADKDYLTSNPNAKVGNVYAKNNTPNSNIDVKTSKEIKILGTPTFLEIRNGKIVNMWLDNEMFVKEINNEKDIK